MISSEYHFWRDSHELETAFLVAPHLCRRATGQRRESGFSAEVADTLVGEGGARPVLTLKASQLQFEEAASQFFLDVVVNRKNQAASNVQQNAALPEYAFAHQMCL
eukprot:s719_g24.t1